MEEIEVITTKRQLMVSIQSRVKVEDISSFMGKAYGELFAFMQMKGIIMTGPPVAYYNSWNDREVDMVCGFPVAAPFHEEGMFKAFELPPVRAVTVVHVGPYPKLVETYTALTEWINANGHMPGEKMWEIYLNDPSVVPKEQLRTQIFWPLK